MTTLTTHITTVAEHIHDVRQDGKQLIVAIAGAPGSGKSTLAVEIARRLIQQRTQAVVVPMDGFHLDNTVLDAAGLTHKKGAPETFDAAGFLRIIKALKTEDKVYFPRFDRSQDLSIAGAVAVDRTTPVVIVEGNYLMFDAPVWRELADHWDVTVRLDVPMPELRARLIQRWLSQNLGAAAATRRAEMNDLPNARAVVENAIACDITLRTHS